jgi:hypothetical protein
MQKRTVGIGQASGETEGHEGLQLRALELMGKHHKLFVEKHEIEFAGSLAERLKAALARADGRANDNVRPGRGPRRRPDASKAAPKDRRAAVRRPG